MNLPFSREQFFDLFAAYNRAVWPAQLVLVAMAVACLVHVARRRPSRRVVGYVLAAFWMWMGAAYHLTFFVDINPLAWVFGAAFLVQGALFAHYSRQDRLVFSFHYSALRPFAFVLVAYSLVGYPALASLAGHTYPAMPTFGLPCPTTIFTLGLLLLARPPVPRVLFIVPLGWSLVGSVAAFKLGVYEDFGLTVSGAIVAALAGRASLARFTAQPGASSKR